MRGRRKEREKERERNKVREIGERKRFKRTNKSSKIRGKRRDITRGVYRNKDAFKTTSETHKKCTDTGEGNAFKKKKTNNGRQRYLQQKRATAVYTAEQTDNDLSHFFSDMENFFRTAPVLFRMVSCTALCATCCSRFRMLTRSSSCRFSSSIRRRSSAWQDGQKKKERQGV